MSDISRQPACLKNHASESGARTYKTFHSLFCKTVIPGLQACPCMIEAGGIQWLFYAILDFSFHSNDVCKVYSLL